MTSITRSLIRRAGGSDSQAILIPADKRPADFPGRVFPVSNVSGVDVSTYPDALRVWRTYSGHQRARVQALAWWRAVALRAERMGILP